MLQEFRIEACRVDLSAYVIEIACKLAKDSSYSEMKDRFSVSNDERSNFADNFFDITLYDSFLANRLFKLAKKNILDIVRVTKQLIF